MKKHSARFYLLSLLFILMVGIGSTEQVMAAAKYATVYDGVDYSKVYNYSYFTKKYPSIKEKYAGNDKKILKYFVTIGMKKQMRGCASFDVKSYRYGTASLRRSYGYHYEKYYSHYMRIGYKSKTLKARATGITRMQNPVTTYNGKSYAKVYDYFYYKKMNPDVVDVVGDDDLKLLEHYVKYGRKEGRRAKSGVAPSGKASTKYDDGTFKASISSCKITDAGKNVTIKATGSGTIGTRIGLFPLESYENSIASGAEPTASTTSKSILNFTVSLNKNTSASLLQKKFVVAAKKSNGSWRICSNSFYIQNPNACASKTSAFPKPARGTKKGLKMVIGNDEYIKKAIDLKCSHVIADFPLEAFLNGSDLAYKYQGKTYYFSSAIKAYQRQIAKLNNAGIVVTGVFYLSGRNMTQYMMPQAANGNRSGSAIFALNTQNANRKKLEALFTCMADYWTKDGAMIANWVFGNESNNYGFYQYSGNVSYSEFITAYCEQFRMFNTAVKSVWGNARTYLSFDHNWNLSFELKGSYRVKAMIESINQCLKKHGAVHWDLALHPYPSPEQDSRFWIASAYVTNSASSQQYTMLNIGKIAAYIKNKYGSSVHIIMPETGFSSYYQGRNTEAEQAAAIALAYYKTEFNSNLDMMGIHREKDDPGEVAGGFSLGLYRSSLSSPKLAADVFKYMDTPGYQKHTVKYLKMINSRYSSWTQAVNGFKGSFFTKY